VHKKGKTKSRPHLHTITRAHHNAPDLEKVKTRHSMAIATAAILAPLCLFCDKPGRKNAVKISCSGCENVFHRTCLAKYQLWTAAELNDFRRKGNYSCWSCCLPSPNDSFWSLPELAPAPPPPPASRPRPRGNKHSISVLSFNARSLKNRRTGATTAAFLETHSTDVIAICESWLKPEVRNHEFIPREYVVLRKDRLVGRGGGVLLAIRPHLQPKRLPQLETHAEVIWAEIRSGEKRLLIGSAYRRPNAEAAHNAALLHSLDLAAALQPSFDGLILLGDFNLNMSWASDPPEARDGIAEDFKSALADMGLVQYVKGPTRTTEATETTLDLLLCDVAGLISTVEVVAGVSDHDAVLAALSMTAVRPSPAPRKVYNFKKANWPALNETLAVRLEVVTQHEEVNEALECWKKIVFECADQHIPKKRVGAGKKKHLLPWLNDDLKSKISDRDALFARWRDTKSREAREAYLVARRSTQRALRTAKDDWLWRLGRGAEGITQLWQFIKSKATIPNDSASFDIGRVTISNPKEVAAHFNESFKGNFSSADNIFPFVRRAPPSAEQQPTISEVICTPADVHKLLCATKENNATGPDGVPAALLKNAATAICASLAHIFNKSLAQGLPSEWKTASVTPIHKDGCKRDFSNYRPISITSLVGKVLERIVRDKLSDFFEANDVIPDTQHGFRRRRSCITLLTGAIDSWTAALDAKSGAHIHAVFLDWSKAFDKVPHERLLSKLEHYGVRGQLLGWCRSFLQGRTQFVKFAGERSEPTAVPSGVIQGSVLGPLLFNVFVADLPKSEETRLDQYADDATLSRLVLTEEDADALQTDLDDVQIWCDNNGMVLNPKKCTVMDVTRARQPLYFEYSVGGVTLQYVDRQRLLGVHLSSDLRWDVHTDTVRAKAAQNLSFVARNLRGCTIRVKKVAYQSLVKPIMTFGLPAWHPTTAANTNKLERVQKRALHFIHGRQLPPVTEQQLMPMAMHLQHTDLVFFKRCTAAATDFDVLARLSEGRSMRGDDLRHPRLQPPTTRSEFGRRAFSFRVVQPWNDLPAALKAADVKKFPGLCRVHLWDKFQQQLQAPPADE
jgi:Reverse transcriptase (RNA-dependent DNA polymerase)/Endonuclease-reverse transcriptase